MEAAAQSDRQARLPAADSSLDNAREHFKTPPTKKYKKREIVAKSVVLALLLAPLYLLFGTLDHLLNLAVFF